MGGGQNSQKVVQATLTGSTYATCQGVYHISEDKFNGRNIWDRVSLDGKPETSRFIFWSGHDWHITGSQRRAEFVKMVKGSMGSFTHSKVTKEEWFQSQWDGCKVEDITYEESNISTQI